MSTAPTHWAADLIGRPWHPLGEGPDEFSCWGLVRWVFRERHGIEMPPIRVDALGDAENVAAIRTASERSGWRQAPAPARVDDIVLMWGREGRHVGVMIGSSRGAVLLHSNGHTAGGVAIGGVVAQPLAIVGAEGFYGFEFWRRSA